MADFVNDAFKQAVGASEEAEYQAYRQEVVNNIGEIAQAAGIMAGVDKMEKLAKIILQFGQEDTLADFTRGLVMAAFHIGYTKGREVV